MVLYTVNAAKVCFLWEEKHMSPLCTNINSSIVRVSYVVKAQDSLMTHCYFCYKKQKTCDMILLTSVHHFNCMIDFSLTKTLTH